MARIEIGVKKSFEVPGNLHFPIPLRNHLQPTTKLDEYCLSLVEDKWQDNCKNALHVLNNDSIAEELSLKNFGKDKIQEEFILRMSEIRQRILRYPTKRALRFAFGFFEIGEEVDGSSDNPKFKLSRLELFQLLVLVRSYSGVVYAQSKRGRKKPN